MAGSGGHALDRRRRHELRRYEDRGLDELQPSLAKTKSRYYSPLSFSRFTLLGYYSGFYSVCLRCEGYGESPEREDGGAFR